MKVVGSAAELAERLRGTGYLADDGLATVGYLALVLDRPLLLEGEPGTGKTSLAEAIALALGLPLIRLQCYEGIDASQALYDWDFPRQLLHLRAAEAAGVSDPGTLEGELYSRRFLLARPLLRALETSPSVLLVDEIDRADDEFEAFLLELLSEYSVTVPELGTLRAQSPPVVVLTSNRTREVHDALKRRCLYHWFEHPGFDRELAIVRRRQPHVAARLAAQVTAVVQCLREQDLVRPPGVADRAQQRPRDEELLGEQLLLGDLGTGRLRGADPQQLPRVVPLIERLRGIDPLVALQANQLRAQRFGQRLGRLGLADPRLALEQEGLGQAQGEEERRRQARVGQVIDRIEPPPERRDVGHRRGHRRFGTGMCRIGHAGRPAAASTAS